MSGEELYRIFEDECDKEGLVYETWNELASWERAAWNRTATEAQNRILQRVTRD